MDLRQLRTFMEVAAQGSLSKAADRLRVAQPALGRQVKQLEDELGVALFMRHGRGMLPTPAGRILLERASAILRLVDETRAEVSAERDAVKGHVSLGLPPTVGEVLAASLVERFLKQYPRVTVRIVPAFSGYLVDMLQRGELDLAITYETGGAHRIKAEPLILETLFLVGPAMSKLSPRRPVPFAALASEPLILPGPGQGLRSLIEETARQAGAALAVSVEAESLQTLKDLVRRGLGYTVLPVASVHTELRDRMLCAAPISDPVLARKLMLSRSIVRPTSNAVDRFTTVLKSEMVDMVRKGVWRGELLLAGPG